MSRHAIVLKPKSKASKVEKVVVFFESNGKHEPAEQAKQVLKSPTRWEAE